jgi:hypothetical protein
MRNTMSEGASVSATEADLHPSPAESSSGCQTPEDPAMIRSALVCLCLALTLIMPRPALAEWPDPGRSLDELWGLFPSTKQLPTGATLVEEGTRSLDELAAGFPDPDDARQVLTDWGWSRTVYRVYAIEPAAPRATTAIPAPDRLEISLHQFATSSTIGSATAGASYALPYFAHGRVVMLGQDQRIELGMRPCEAAVMGVGAGGDTEYTYYIRSGSLLIRVTAATSHTEGALYYIVMPPATQMAGVVLQNAGKPIQGLAQTCQ